MGTDDGRTDAFAVGLQSSDGDFKSVAFLDRGASWYLRCSQLTKSYGRLDSSDVE